MVCWASGTCCPWQVSCAPGHELQERITKPPGEQGSPGGSSSMQRVLLVAFQGTLWPSCPCATCLLALPPAFAGSCPCKRACPDQHLLLSLPALGQGRDVPSSQTLPVLSWEPSTAFPFWGFSSSAKWVQLPPSLVSCRLLPALTIAICTPQLSPAACRWTRGTASTTHCGGTTTKESPNAGPSSTAAAGATSTASTARRSASCTVGSTQGQVGMALAGLAASPPGATSSADAEPGGMMLVPHLSFDTPLLLSTDAHGVASGKLGGQSKA